MFTVKQRFQMVFFDRSVIRTNWRAINETPIKKAGLLTMRISRGSIRRVPKGKTRTHPPSAPGTPPRSRKPGKTPPFKQIFSVPNWAATQTVVGMVHYGTYPPVPGLHEHGGTARRKVITGQEWKTINHKPKLVTYRQWKQVRYPARPFMLPALLKAKARIPPLWKNSISRAA